MDFANKYNPRDAEPKWQKYWEEQGIYKFDPESSNDVYSIDTPPPTISGKMHLGHSFSYSHQDFIARFHRMLGKNVFYPFGTDDNGVPTERLIEKMKNVRSKQMPRQDFVKLCLETLEKEIRPAFVHDWKRLGMSCDWSIYYTTIDEHCQRISQRSFIDLYKMGREYRKDAPALWCPECETGISQQECQDKELDSSFCDIVFKVDGSELIIATTRPEMLCSCVAIFYHPEDKRYSKLKGKNARVPLYESDVPILPDRRVDMEKGTGIVMCCTFGDQTDMEWQRAYNLPIKMSISGDGRMNELAGRYKGQKIKEARKEIIKELESAGLLKATRPIKHAVKVHERCKTEIEFVKSKQWFIKYLDLKEEMLKWGASLNWYPSHMRVRYDHWINGLQWDWLISRQRYFGVPFPVWYCAKCEEVILADEKKLPVDPLKDPPPVKKCPKCGSLEFVPEKDVLDTWATSSLSPHLCADLFKGHKIYKKLYPMSLRPQAHDIITFWLFNTLFKSRIHDGVNPWKDVAISGHVQDPHGKKMSKSLGNTIEPQVMIEKYSADALRYFAAGSKLGDDVPFQEKEFVAADRTIIKLWNAAKFTIGFLVKMDAMQGLGKIDKAALTTVDRWILTKLEKAVKASTDNFLNYEYSRTRQEAEAFFWRVLCDNYLELIKYRLYDEKCKTRNAAVQTLFSSFLSALKLFAPIMPHITEEIYQMHFAGVEGKKSIHISGWPKYDETLMDLEAEKAGDLLVELVSAIRKHKSEKQVSLKTPIKRLVIECGNEARLMLASVENDLKASMSVEQIEYGNAGEIGISEGLSIRVEF